VSPKKRKRRVDYYHDPDAPTPITRPPSASVVVRNAAGELLLLRRTDNDLWAIPGGKVEIGETAAQAGVREVKEETGLDVEVTGLVGIFSDPGHVIVYLRGKKIREIRQPFNVCLRARPVAGHLTPAADEATDVRWIDPTELDTYDIHPAIRLRINRGLDEASAPYIG